MKGMQVDGEAAGGVVGVDRPVRVDRFPEGGVDLDAERGASVSEACWA
ncbi:hypothetical protein K7B10_07915 [Streptomyces flavotricini]|uniref:Uncharacterized protein n=1 Tax=Streptomyces flavotricini TaxID=66888 RepID=A0ABS8E0W9_9ACTN|nr:hypothetical protein [Streptomyces flavotricini]MCC0094711.1 hypothetical protein [Streptomyces flavotricini]